MVIQMDTYSHNIIQSPPNQNHGPILTLCNGVHAPVGRLLSLHGSLDDGQQLAVRAAPPQGIP